MARIIKLLEQKQSKSALHKEIIKKYDTPGRNPEEAIDGMYGLWESRGIPIETIRAEKRRKKW